MKRLLQFVMGLVLALGIPAAHAVDVELVRATCTPDDGLFRIEHHVIDSSGIDHDNVREEQRLTRLWEKQGYHRVDRFRQDCALSKVGYQVRVDREPYKADGQCSQKPRVNLTLLSNGQPILKDVPYGADCYGAVAVTSLEIPEAYRGGAPEMTLCLAYPYDTPKCVPTGPDYMRIGTRSPDGMLHIHPPLDRYGIDSLFERVDRPSSWRRSQARCNRITLTAHSVTSERSHDPPSAAVTRPRSPACRPGRSPSFQRRRHAGRGRRSGQAPGA